MGTAFLLPLLFKTNVPQHEHNTCAPPCTNKFYIQGHFRKFNPLTSKG